jgi:leucyl/phenylalanyl-tRNA--protein transferase
MLEAYKNLHQLGYAHSFETYRNGDLVGGLYGLSLGRVFYGESMFYKASDASKFAMFYLVKFCKKHQFEFIDAQQPTKHLKSLGAVEMERGRFLDILKEAITFKSIVGKWKMQP